MKWAASRTAPVETRTGSSGHRGRQSGFLMRAAAAQRLGRLNLLRLLQCFFLSHSVSPSLVIEARILLLPVNAESQGKLAHFFTGDLDLRAGFALLSPGRSLTSPKNNVTFLQIHSIRPRWVREPRAVPARHGTAGEVE